MEVNVDDEIKEMQQARVQLRESFLRGVSDLIGEQGNIVTYEKTSLSAIFYGLNPIEPEILVRDLHTPAAVKINSAKLRTPDVLAVEFNRPVELS